MIQEIKKLVYHSDLNGLGIYKRILIKELLLFIMSILTSEDDFYMVRKFEIIQEIVLKEFHYE